MKYYIDYYEVESKFPFGLVTIGLVTIEIQGDCTRPTTNGSPSSRHTEYVAQMEELGLTRRHTLRTNCPDEFGRMLFYMDRSKK